MIILTQAQAERVRGFCPSRPQGALAPVPIRDGSFILNESVLEDDCHIDVRTFLEGLPKRSVASEELFSEEEISEVLALALPSWQEAGERG